MEPTQDTNQNTNQDSAQDSAQDAVKDETRDAAREAAREASLQAQTAANTAANRPPRTHLRGGFCEPDPLDPDRVPCNARVEHEDRQGISHFFGRNKRATSTIPTSCYPLLCRNHYQERKYRMKDMPGHEAGQQCDAIAITLKRMSRLTWTDAKGLVWPRWSGFELQLCHARASGDEEEQQSDDEDATPAPKTVKKKRSTVQFAPDTKTQADDDAKPKRKQRVKTVPAPVPEWLQNVCSAKKQGQSEKFNPIGDRCGARYGFEDMARIVRHIKSYCINNNVRLPVVEALPVTAGLQAEVDVKAAKRGIEGPARAYNKAKNELADAAMRGRNTGLLQDAVMRREAELNGAKEKVEKAKRMLEHAKETLPEKRVPRKKGESVTPAPEGEDAGAAGKGETLVHLDEDDEFLPRRKRGQGSRSAKKAAVAGTVGAAQEEESKAPVDEDEGFPPPRKRGQGYRSTKQAATDAADAGAGTRAPPLPSQVEMTLPSPMRKLFLSNKKAPVVPSTPTAPAKTTSSVPASPATMAVTAALATATPTTARPAARDEHHTTPFGPARYTTYAAPANAWNSAAAAIADEDSDDDVVITGVITKQQPDKHKRKRVPLRLAPGVAAESDTEGDTDEDY